MAEPDEAVDASEAAPARKSKKKLLVILGALVLLLGGIGGGATWYFTHHKSGKAAEAEPEKPPIFVPLDTFTVNLQDGEQFLQIEITLQVSDPVTVEAIKLHMPRVRDRLLGLLSSKSADELATAEDKKQLTQEILALMRQPFDPKGKPQQIDDALFTSFVIQ